MKAPVGLLSDRTVLRSKMEGLCPDKFQFTVLLPSRVWGRHAPTRPRLRSNERPSGAFEWQPGLAQARWRGFAPTRATSKCGSVAEVQSRRNATFSRIENLWSRDGSCSLHFWHFGERCFTMDIEIKRMSSDTIELFDRLNIVCKRFHVDDPHASEKDRFFVEAVALHEYQLKRLMSRG